MNEIWLIIVMGSGVALAVQGLKLAGIPLAGKQTIIRLVVAVAALVLAYIALQGQADIAIAEVLAYAAGIIASAEGVYKWLIQQVTKRKE